IACRTSSASERRDQATGEGARRGATRKMRPQVVEMARLLLPGEANALGAAFGGSVVGWIDMCAAIAAQRHCRQTVVTASMDDLHFHAPIKVGWSVTVKARVIAAFNTSLEVGAT